MKKLCIFITILLSSVASHAQMQLDDFYKTGATWCEEKVVGAGMGTYWLEEHFEWRIDGDTNINSISYHKLRNLGRTYGGIRVSTDTVFFLRTDTTNYFHGTNNPSYKFGPPVDTEVVLYKFDLQINDVISWRYAGNSTINDITTVQLTNGQMVSQYSFDTYESWIYGVGGTRGLFDAYVAGYGPYYMRTYTSPTAAFSFAFSYPVRHGSPTGSNGPFTPCFPTAVGEVFTDDGGFAIYPNPVVGESFQLVTKLTVKQIQVTDVTGKLIYQTAQTSPGNKIFSLPQTPGIYVLQAEFADGSVATRKIIKQ